ncbi:unnamed protein product [Allacma fusca]|uniref:Uncharacterized protein n=1 Tax=Allacma fusca TaxID=39272 RepID=A0A8J2JSL2_9HEXA|nr:unnamed protein product [Allacma fusca]
MKRCFSTQMVAFGDCIWSTYEVFSTSLTFFASSHFNGIFQSEEKLITVEVPGEGLQKTYIWTVLILTLITSVVWVDSSIQLLIGTRKVEKVSETEIKQCRYWLHLSFGLLFLFAFKTYSNTGYVSAFIVSCLALLYRGAVIFIVHEEIHSLERQLLESASTSSQPHRVHFMDTESELLYESDSV